MNITSLNPENILRDGVGRVISYVRLSLTDRCDMRCRYCMAEKMIFMPRRELLTLEEVVTLARHFVARGVKRIRLTGGEPLVRRGAVLCAQQIGELLGQGLDELTLTTNGANLAEHAAGLWQAGIRRINISLDTREPEKFSHITRLGRLEEVLAGIDAAKAQGFQIKINMVALKGFNEAEIADMLSWCGAQGFDLSLIETMPLGQISDNRPDQFLSLIPVLASLQERFTLVETLHRTGGPARYLHVAEYGTRLGLISPMTRNFCEGCNRIRVSAAGQLYMCLGHEDRVDLRAALRSGDEGDLNTAIDRALRLKAPRHNFDIATTATHRHMNVTGG